MWDFLPEFTFYTSLYYVNNHGIIGPSIQQLIVFPWEILAVFLRLHKWRSPCYMVQPTEFTQPVFYSWMPRLLSSLIFKITINKNWSLGGRLPLHIQIKIFFNRNRTSGFKGFRVIVMVWKWFGSSQDGGVNWTSCLGHWGAHTAKERGVGAVSEIKAKRFGGQLNAGPTNLQQCSYGLSNGNASKVGSERIRS